MMSKMSCARWWRNLRGPYPVGSIVALHVIPSCNGLRQKSSSRVCSQQDDALVPSGRWWPNDRRSSSERVTIGETVLLSGGTSAFCGKTMSEMI